MIPDISEIFHPECWPCPVCTASEGEDCDPGCYAGWDRAIYYYVPDDLGKRLLEGKRRYHLARALAAAQEEAEKDVAIEAEKPVEKSMNKRRKAR